MEQHPVPRNITSFQFHLIGDMTLRQFAYLAGGILASFIIYKTAPLPSIIKYPLVGVAGLVGLAFAFLPIQERPLDRWLVAFIKSVYSPTQYLWKREGAPPTILVKPAVIHIPQLPQVHAQAQTDAREKLRAYLSSLPTQPHQTLNVAEKNYIDKTLSLFNTTIIPQAVSPKPQIANIPPTAKGAPPSPLEGELTKLAAEKEALTKELERLKKEKKQLSPNVVKPEPAVEKTVTIKTVTPSQAVDEVGLPTLPQTPNVVIGVVKDSDKRLLPNIILTIKDSKGLPLRALKTNKLGQFAVATPLPNGTYLVEVEDPLKRYVFDIAEISLSGKVFLPIEITAKGEKEQLREKLTKELFRSENI